MSPKKIVNLGAKSKIWVPTLYFRNRRDVITWGQDPKVVEYLEQMHIEKDSGEQKWEPIPTVVFRDGEEQI